MQQTKRETHSNICLSSFEYADGTGACNCGLMREWQFAWRGYFAFWSYGETKEAARHRAVHNKPDRVPAGTVLESACVTPRAASTASGFTTRRPR